MADAVAQLTGWRRRRETRTREVVKTEMSENLAKAIRDLGARVERLERVIAALAAEAERGG